MFNHGGITDEGSKLLTQAVGGKTLTFTRMEYGDGVHDSVAAARSEEELLTAFRALTALKKKRANIAMYSVRSQGSVTTLTGKVKVDADLTEDFYSRELLVYARIEAGEEMPFAYFTAVDYLDGEKHDSSECIVVDSLVGQEHKIVVNVATGGAGKVNFLYDPGTYPTKEEFDTLKQRVDGLTGTGGGAVSASMLNPYMKFDHVVDSDETLSQWANCKDKSMKSVLVKAGEYTLEGKMINLVLCGTKYVFAEADNKITVKEYSRGIGATENYGAVVIGLNVSVDNSSYEGGAVDGVFYRGMTCINCTAGGHSTGGVEGVFNKCSVIDCFVTATSDSAKVDFFGCKGLSSI